MSRPTRHIDRCSDRDLAFGMKRSMVMAGLVGTLALGGVVGTPVSTSASTTGPTASDRSTVSAQALPPRSIRHQGGPHWVWFGPRNWQAATGAYGITITSPEGLRSLDYGFSSILCATGNTLGESVNRHFAQQRAAVRNAGTWRRVRMQAGPIRRLSTTQFGVNYFRQVVAISGRAQGVAMRGELVFDYSLATGPTYCFSRNQSRVAPANGFGVSIRQLRSMQGALAYSAPSYCAGNTVDAVCRSDN